MDDKSTLKQRSMSRRTLLKVAGVGASALALGSTLAFNSQAAEAATFYKGADISWVPQMEATGHIWKNASGAQQDILTILKGFGINAARLRTWVNPSGDPVNGHCSIGETAAMAVRCKNAGLSVMIDFHFGDTWNSVGVQNPPAAWASLTYSQMLSTMFNYVFHSMNVVKANGVTPAWVQIGNEINSGICHPVGSVSNPAQMTGLLNAAYDMVKEVFPSTPVLIHLAQPQNATSIENFFNAYVANGGRWDISAFSSYGSGSSTISTIISNINTYKSLYGKPVIQVEFGGRFDRATRTEADLQSYITGMKSIGGLGVFYWEPEVYSPFTSYNMGAWDPTTLGPTVALNGFLNA
ncbi:MAG TPA: glycosyl hydrolase 53 family protein [Ktedonobacteraceae bacterium]|nr:glycosyl hydrolase 53 family protein [Ktedonobacteraceae bacterium]